MNPFLAVDGYKTGHHKMYPQGTTLVYSNGTPRSTKFALGDRIVSFGQQMVMQQIHEMFEEHFFGVAKIKVISEIKTAYTAYLGAPYDTTHISKLHDLGYLPIHVKSLPEGITVNPGIPVLTIYNTLPEFFWLTNFLETLISTLIWKPMTSASIAHEYKKILYDYIQLTDEENIGFLEFQAHDFSMRGMSGLDSTVYSALGHAVSFTGSDSLPAIYGVNKFYGTDGKYIIPIASVNATEHSVMCAGGDENELETFRYLMKQFPTGILSIVSDTWNLWDVCTKILPQLKDEILARDGKIVIRPDSGDPVDIVCGTGLMSSNHSKELRLKPDTDWSKVDKLPSEKGVIELLWDVFGGTINSQGFKVLDPHIGCIYGDSITLERADKICKRLFNKGFASTNIVLGVGSFTYQYNTRDTYGFAMKATYVEINGVGREIFKDPITDPGKKSAKGLLTVMYDPKEEDYMLVDEVSWDLEHSGFLDTIYLNGKLVKKWTLQAVRDNLNNEMKHGK